MGSNRRRFWAAARTGHRSEGLARLSLQSSGREVYFPQYRERAKRGVRRILPLFERHVFVRLSPVKGWGDVSSMKGIDYLLLGAGGEENRRPYAIPDHEIEHIRSLEGSDGYVHIEDEEPPAFQLGDIVAATRGAFQDQLGSYRGIDPTNPRRANVAFELLGCEVISSVIRYDLARSGALPAH